MNFSRIKSFGRKAARSAKRVYKKVRRFARGAVGLGPGADHS